eukprot:CAMPEP_0179317466 /NCGR_PEP_ID=MMETSP0797-20121207/56273_1 /TAXON_ID=47934 /ORGANISM="Dinophysis acuminata, Strain DAEP01" /LENGTH=455 /DNA_ID=CAMNT_0021028385 /DNA_START=20 /DNA_END=1384 /DNA_ORIENTATION=-
MPMSYVADKPAGRSVPYSRRLHCLRRHWVKLLALSLLAAILVAWRALGAFRRGTGQAGAGPGGAQGPFIGVNLGGWLLIEDYLWAWELREKNIPDEYTLTQSHGGPQDPRAVALITAHRETFVTEEDLDRLQSFGVSHVRVPVGWWLVDYDPADGFVDGGERYLFRLVKWLKRRGMRALLDLHALPGAQVANQSFTGRVHPKAYFFLRRGNYERGKWAMLKLAELILRYEAAAETSGVVMGMELINEPTWDHWDTSPGIRELFEAMVPQLRRLLPADRFLLFLNFMESPRTLCSTWLATMRARDPLNYMGVVYDAHVYHSFGDDNKKGREWDESMDSCKTCCRDRATLAPLVEDQLPIAIGEYSLNTGFPGNEKFYVSFIRNQLSIWANTPGVIGSFFWTHRVLREAGGWYKEMSLLELLKPHGAIPPALQMNLSAPCPGLALSRCPPFDPRTTL